MRSRSEEAPSSEQITAYVPVCLATRVREVHAIERRSISSVVTEALEAWFAQREEDDHGKKEVHDRD
jgi:hypothetical protein